MALHLRPAHPTVSLHLLELRNDYESFLGIFLPRSTHLLSMSMKLCLNASKKVMEGGRERRKGQNRSVVYSNSITILYCDHLDRTVRDFPFLVSPNQQPLQTEDLPPFSAWPCLPAILRTCYLLPPSQMSISSLLFFFLNLGGFQGLQSPVNTINTSFF